MNARAEGFSDSDSLYTKRRTIVTDVNSGTASAKRESFPLEDFGGPVVRYPYESDAPTTHPHDLISLIRLGVLTVNLDVTPSTGCFLSAPGLSWNLATPVRHPVIIAGRVFNLLQDWNVSQRCFVFPPSDASTLPFPFTRPSAPPILELDWSSCLAGFVDEEIEDGMTASLGEKISNLIRFHGSEAIERLKELITSNELSPSLASHTLRWLGRIKDPASLDSRLDFLCANLRSKSPVIRDGASLGLAALGSRKAIPYLAEAIKQEKLPALRADLEQVLTELKN